MERAAGTIEALGRDVAKDDEAIKALLPKLMEGTGKVITFGRGLALGADNPKEMWRSIGNGRDPPRSCYGSRSG